MKKIQRVLGTLFNPETNKTQVSYVLDTITGKEDGSVEVHQEVYEPALFLDGELSMDAVMAALKAGDDTGIEVVNFFA